MLCGSVFTARCQLKKFYSVKDDQSYDTVHFSMRATSGTCFVKSSHHDDPLTIYGNPDFSEVNPSFKSSRSSRTKIVCLDLEDYNKKGLGQAISYSMFGSADELEQNYWKVFLTSDKVYQLNLHYGVGDANVDLSGVAVSRLRLESGSADVRLSYDASLPNQCTMDTLEINVDMGTVVIDRLNATKAQFVKTDVGFGTVVLDLSQGITQPTMIRAMIGAGKLRVLMPVNGIPTKVHFNSSPLCRIKFEHAFTETEKGVYLSENYQDTAPNIVTFDLDVALGNITFESVQ